MDSSFHKLNRERLAKKMANSSVLFLQSKDPIMKGDSEFFDIPDVNIFYLTGIEQPKTKLIIYKNSKGNFEEVLFIQDKDKKKEIWEGEKLSIAQAKKISGIEYVHYEEYFKDISERIFNKSKKIYFFKDEKLKLKNKSEYELKYSKIKSKHKLKTENFYNLISVQRQKKSKEEIEEIKSAMKITNKSFRDIMKNIKKFKTEKGVEAKISYNYIANNCNHSYHPIVASGVNACTLHYIRNNQKLKKGDLLLIDSGAQFNNYKTDVTRTFPISGKFSKRQKEIYSAVLEIQKKAIKILKPNLSKLEWEKYVFNLMAEKLISLGLINESQLERDPKIVRKFYPHSTGHFLGLDTHDLGDFNTNFKIGEVYTVEPGIYIEKENIGIRIEDNILITKSGCEVLSKKIPKEIKDIEELCK